jgi:hypothetical protein
LGSLQTKRKDITIIKLEKMNAYKSEDAINYV